jgi:hypothetical protein
MNIDENFIHKEASQLIGLITPYVRRWATPLSRLEVGRLPQSLSATTYGLAHPDGVIQISSFFVGTTFTEALKETIIHELCHLITGLNYGHNKNFKRNLNSLLTIASIDVDLVRAQKRILVNSIKPSPKYNLIAVCSDETEIVMGEFHKKNKKYTGYTPGDKPWLVDRKPIQSFRYVEAR